MERTKAAVSVLGRLTMRSFLGVCITYCNTTTERIHRMATDYKRRRDFACHAESVDIQDVMGLSLDYAVRPRIVMVKFAANL